MRTPGRASSTILECTSGEVVASALRLSSDREADQLKSCCDSLNFSAFGPSRTLGSSDLSSARRFKADVDGADLHYFDPLIESSATLLGEFNSLFVHLNSLLGWVGNFAVSF
jgi:hypothetical protein